MSYTPFQLLQHLQQRAERLESLAPLESNARGGWLAFRLGALKPMLPTESVIELISAPQLTPVPDAAPWFLGLTVLRGTIVSVMDTRLLLGMTSREVDPQEARVLVLNASGWTLGLFVDRVEGVRRFSQDEQTVSSPLEAPIQTWIDHVYEVSEERWQGLSPMKVIQDAQWRNATRSPQ